METGGVAMSDVLSGWGDRMLLAMLTLAAFSTVQAACDQPVGTFVSLTGVVDVQPSGSGDWDAASLDSRLCEGDTIRVGERSRAAVSLINDAVLRIDQNTAMRLIDITPQEQETSLLDMFSGAFQSFSRKPKFLKVNTPYLNGSVEGTEFAIRVDDGSATITVLEGRVVASNDQGEVAVQPGEAAQARKGQAPTREIVVNPRDQVQWALYYPPILSATAVAEGSPSLSEAANCAANGNTACAFAALDGVPAAQRDANYLLLRASVLLAAGRVNEARADIDSAIARDDEASAAHALRAVIGAAQNENEAALADGRRAVELDPGSAVAKIALSYALQANLELEAARDVLQQAVEQSPDNALAWARLAELQLAEGRRHEATASAERAVQLQPGLSRTQNVLGFSALAEINVSQAQAAFEQAIALDSADPLPHLGLGLAQIRQGLVAEGRKQIEAAVALDSNNALLRAYLGKAYFEEKRGPLDAKQLEVAKELDPLDPTAYLYDAIRLQTENRPVEALHELEASIERNDNRAVYRSRLLLDQDRAARGTSQARMYNDLGFRQLGIEESAHALTLDPANASSHRFLSDTYRGGTRHEVARVSELLQAQMLQDVNINPVQPSVSSTNLNIVARGGPANTGFNEFTPLFERDQAKLDVTGAVGNNDTRTGEAVVSGIYDRFSLSAGGFGYDSDGFRPNNDLKHEIYNFYAQAALAPTVNVQAEFEKRRTTRGDLAMKFDPNDFDPTYRRKLDADTWRVGARISPTPNSNILLSVINANRDIEGTEKEELFSVPGLGSFNLRTDSESNDDTYQYDAQYIFQGEDFNALAGGSYTDVDREDTLAFVFETPFGDDPPDVIQDDFRIKDKRAYAYGNFTLGEHMIWTLGLSYQSYEEGDVFDFNETSPKLGLQWNVNDAVKLRGAYIEGVKPVLSSNRTLEPTQVAGFNQYFDDANATKFKRYGVGADWKLSRDLAVGAEVTKRDLESPTINANTGKGIFEDRDEWTHRLYGYWTPADRWSLSGEFVYDKFRNKRDSVMALDVPKSVTTLSLPVVARYFHPNGLFATLGATYVDQEVDGENLYLYETGSSDFVVFDLGVGYRLPKRQGVLSLVVQNLFDREFDYLDDSYRTFQDEPSVGPYTPERTIMGTVTLSF